MIRAGPGISQLLPVPFGFPFHMILDSVYILYFRRYHFPQSSDEETEVSTYSHTLSLLITYDPFTVESFPYSTVVYAARLITFQHSEDPEGSPHMKQEAAYIHE